MSRLSPYAAFIFGSILGVLLMATVTGVQDRPWLWGVYGLLGLVYMAFSMVLPSNASPKVEP